MLDGKASRRHHQNLINQAQHDRLAKDVKAARGDQKAASPLRAMLIAIFNLIIG